MKDLDCTCSQPFVQKHGQPAQFVRDLFGGPAITVQQFIEQNALLIRELSREEACAEYRETAIHEHMYLLNDDHDNRIHYRDSLLVTLNPEITLRSSDIRQLGGYAYYD